MYKSIVNHWVTLYINVNNMTYFDSFVVEYIPKEILKTIGNKDVITNIQAYHSITCGYFCNGLIDFEFKSKILTDLENSFLPNNVKKGDEISLIYFLNAINVYILYPEIFKALQFRLHEIGKVKKYFI